MDASEIQLDYDFYDLQSRRQRGKGGQMYLCDARPLLGDGTSVVFEDGWAGKVPAVQVRQILTIRNDIYAVESPDQTPLPIVDHSASPELTEVDFEALPPGAIAGNPQAVKAAVVDGHKTPPGRPVISEAEQERRRQEAQAYLDALPVAERLAGTAGPDAAGATTNPVAGPETLASDGLPIEIPPGVIPGETPGWPMNEMGQPLRLTDEQRAETAQAFIAKTGTEVAPVLGTAAPEPQPGYPTPEPPTGAGDGTNPDGTPVKLAPIPQGFEAQTADGQGRCLASKADSSQCQNPARPPQYPQACQIGPHQEQVDAAAAAAP